MTQASAQRRTSSGRARRVITTSRCVGSIDPRITCRLTQRVEPQAAGKEKLRSAEATANGYAADTSNAVTKQYDAAKASATEAYNSATTKVGDAEAAAKATYADAKQKASETKQSWGAWFGSWFGYGKGKAEEVESKTAADVAAGAAKVQREAEKRE